MSPDGKTVYVTDFSNETVTPINTLTNTADTPIKVGMLPEIFPGIASNGNALLVSGLTFVARARRDACARSRWHQWGGS
ncbi:MAG: hypothetical protein WB586_28425 [Chthoniobacterales bacterium]